MRFSLINVSEEKDGSVSGNWIQDFTGTLEEAIEWAKDTEAANSFRIDVAVVEQIGGYIGFDFLTNMKRLDERRIKNE